MEQRKPSSIKTAGIVVSISAVMMMFSNGSGALVHLLLETGSEVEDFTSEEFDPLQFMFSHYIQICIIMLILGGSFLLGGIYLMKYKLWANRLLSLVSGLLIIAFMGIMIILGRDFSQQEGMETLWFFPPLVGLSVSAPLAFLIYFLNKKIIKQHFD